MNILVTLDSNYIKPLKVMLKSLFLNNPGEVFTIYLIHADIHDAELEDLERFIGKDGSRLEAIKIDEAYFSDAPTLLHYTKAMYYRLLAFEFLPKNVDRILYLDPDILVINPIRELYETDLDGYLYAAAYHDRAMIKGVNKIRLNAHEMKAYYNSGVLLMNVERQRQRIDKNAIFDFVKNNHAKLIMPDQDVLNALFGDQIKSLAEILYNYDVRYYHCYKIKHGGQCDMDFIFTHTVILHFCGKKKPWKKNYRGKFHSLYKHYENLALVKSVQEPLNA